jgi:hypothetical protein
LPELLSTQAHSHGSTSPCPAKDRPTLLNALPKVEEISLTQQNLISIVLTFPFYYSHIFRYLKHVAIFIGDSGALFLGHIARLQRHHQ